VFRVAHGDTLVRACRAAVCDGKPRRRTRSERPSTLEAPVPKVRTTAEKIYAQRTRHPGWPWLIFWALTAEIAENADDQTER
jgi:hypothetical protein